MADCCPKIWTGNGSRGLGSKGGIREPGRDPRESESCGALNCAVGSPPGVARGKLRISRSNLCSQPTGTPNHRMSSFNASRAIVPDPIFGGSDDSASRRIASFDSHDSPPLRKVDPVHRLERKFTRSGASKFLPYSSGVIIRTLAAIMFSRSNR